jgi:hypothetical protein
MKYAPTWGEHDWQARYVHTRWDNVHNTLKNVNISIEVKSRHLGQITPFPYTGLGGPPPYSLQLAEH